MLYGIQAWGLNDRQEESHQSIPHKIAKATTEIMPKNGHGRIQKNPFDSNGKRFSASNP
jgi:hypothetical protein